MAILTSELERRRVFRDTHVITVLGAHSETWRPAFYVPDYLYAQGYRILPVNPRLAGQRLWGEEVVASLSEVAEAVDMVNVFRPSDALPNHLAELLALSPRPQVVWFQLGIAHNDVAQSLSLAGIDVVQDRCALVDHQRMR